jgi:hypothetical protein
MDRSAELLLYVIRTERALADSPANQERRRIARLAAEISRCCRVSIVDRLLAALDRPVIAPWASLR